MLARPALEARAASKLGAQAIGGGSSPLCNGNTNAFECRVQAQLRCTAERTQRARRPPPPRDAGGRSLCCRKHDSYFCNILWVTTVHTLTQLFLTQKDFFSSSLGRLILKKQGLSDDGVPLFSANFPEGLHNDFAGLPCPGDRSGCAARCCEPATELRRSRCCDGDAQTSSVALILRVASRHDALNGEPASFSPC